MIGQKKAKNKKESQNIFSKWEKRVKMRKETLKIFVAWAGKISAFFFLKHSVDSRLPYI